jgi:antiviral defense system Shedu protein SduA
VATELSLFGDFTCDAASGDSKANAFVLIEFEDANEYSILKQVAIGRSMRAWSSRFEHGFSQLVDWAWRLAEEGSKSAAYQGIFGKTDATVHFLLIAGRDADLSDNDAARLRWRARNIAFGPFRMACFTFDGVLDTLRRRMEIAPAIRSATSGARSRSKKGRPSAKGIPRKRSRALRR